MEQTNNIVLIGMPATGKSTIGVLLAKVIGWQFADSDLLIQQQEGKLLREIIAERGHEGFLAVENQVNRDIQAKHTVIATGGSAVYCAEAMEHLRKIGTVVYLKTSFSVIERRLEKIHSRGVVLKEGQGLKELYEERIPLYEAYAHVTIEMDGLDAEQALVEVCSRLSLESE